MPHLIRWTTTPLRGNWHGLRQVKVYDDCEIGVDGYTIACGRLVTPLAHRLHSGARQPLSSHGHLEHDQPVGNPVGSDHDLQDDIAGDFLFPGALRIDGKNC